MLFSSSPPFYSSTHFQNPKKMRDSSSLVEDSSDPYEYSFEETKTRSRISEALGGSVSFGRFLSQSLDWGKWSSFCQKSYLEEIEKYSTPGSVAEKKAFFEAHYKKSAARKSIALLEQDNARENRAECHEENDAHSSKVTVNSAKEPNLSEEKRELEIEDKVTTEPFLQIGALDTIDDDIEKENRVNGMEYGTTKPFDRHPLKGASVLNQEKRDSTEERLRFPTLRPTATHGKENKSTPNGKKNKTESEFNEKKESTLKSLHMSINFSQERKGGANYMMNRTSPILTKVEELKVVSSSLKSIQNSSDLASSRASLRGANPASVTTQSVDGRSGIPLDKRHSGRAKVDANSHRYSAVSSKSLSNHLQSQNASSSLRLRTAERVEKRKELEHNFHRKDAAKALQLREMPEEKPESAIKKLRESLNFKARPLPDFYHNREPQKSEIKKVPQRKSDVGIHSSSLPPRQSIKSNQCTRELRSSTTLGSKKNNSGSVLFVKPRI